MAIVVDAKHFPGKVHSAAGMGKTTTDPESAENGNMFSLGEIIRRRTNPEFDLIFNIVQGARRRTRFHLSSHQYLSHKSFYHPKEVHLFCV